MGDNANVDEERVYYDQDEVSVGMSINCQRTIAFHHPQNRQQKTISISR
jgi:hypothetical protein